MWDAATVIKRTSRERLDHFVRTTRQIEAEHDLSTVSTRLNIKYDATGLSSSLAQPEFHRLRSLLVAIRPYILVRDDVYLPTVFADCRAHITDPDALAGTESAATAYGNMNSGGGIQIEINGVRVTPEDAASLFLYGGGLVHSDKDKEDRLSTLDPLARSLLRNEYLTYMLAVLEIAIWTASVISNEEGRGRLRPIGA